MKKIALITVIAIAAGFPIAAEGAFGLTINNGSMLFPADAAALQSSLYAQADYAFYLGAFILQPTVDVGACESGLTADAGLGLGWRILKTKTFSLETAVTPFAGVAGYQTTRIVWGARAMIRARLRLIGHFGILAQLGAEWRNGTGAVDVPVAGLGLSF